MNSTKDFFVEIDKLWTPSSASKLQLSLIGCGALIVQANYQRGTKDSDLFETTEMSAPIQKQLLQIAGAGTPLHQRRKLYLEIVGNGIPFLPRAPTWNPVPDISKDLYHFEFVVLDVVDVVVSKLKRFHANDQSDIDAMITCGLVPMTRWYSVSGAQSISSVMMRGRKTSRNT
jgi:hypothetical protein